MSEPPRAAIEVRNLTKRFGGVPAVSGFNLDCAKGEVFGFVGPDGAGKTTIMRLLAAVMAPDEGRSRSKESMSSPTPSWRERTSATCPSASAFTRI